MEVLRSAEMSMKLAPRLWIFSMTLALTLSVSVLCFCLPSSGLAAHPQAFSTKVVFKQHDFSANTVGWSPDGRLLAVEGGARLDPMQVWVAPLDGKKPFRIVGGLLRSPVFNSGSDQLFLVKLGKEDASLVTADINSFRRGQGSLTDMKRALPRSGPLHAVGREEFAVGDFTEGQPNSFFAMDSSKPAVKKRAFRFVSRGGKMLYVDEKTGKEAIAQSGDAAVIREGLVKYPVGDKRFIVDDGERKRLFRKSGLRNLQRGDVSANGRFVVSVLSQSSNGLSLESSLVIEDLQLSKTFNLALPAGAIPGNPALNSAENKIAWIDQENGWVYVTEVKGIR